MDRNDPAYNGQRHYNRFLLNAYDPLVLGPIARFVWRCRTTLLVEGYRRHIRARSQCSRHRTIVRPRPEQPDEASAAGGFAHMQPP